MTVLPGYRVTPVDIPRLQHCSGVECGSGFEGTSNFKSRFRFAEFDTVRMREPRPDGQESGNCCFEKRYRHIFPEIMSTTRVKVLCSRIALDRNANYLVSRLRFRRTRFL